MPDKVGGLLSASSSPLLVAVTHLDGHSGGCGDWIVSKPPQDLTPIPANYDDSALENWIYGNDAADTYATWLQVTIQGRSSRPVVLTDLQFIVVHRNFGRVSGALVGNACGGPMQGRYMEVDLSQQPVRILGSYKDPAAPPGAPAWDLTPVVFPYVVSDTDTEVFMITAYANQCDCEWYAELYWSSGGKSGEAIIDDRGRPFRTAPPGRVQDTYSYDPKSMRWYKNSGSCPQLTNFTCTNV